MITFFMGILFLVQIITAGCCEVPQSPCPEFFRYFQDKIRGDIMGLVEIPSPLPRGVPFMLKVTLNYPSVLPERHKGSLELIKPKNVARPVQQAIDEGKSLFFRIQFPIQWPLPVLKEIVFNNRQLCLGPQVRCSVATFINFEKTIYPPEFLARIYNQSNSNNYPNPVQKCTTSMRPNNFELKEACGISYYTNFSIDFRFGKGEKSYFGQWPWLAAIFIRSIIDFEFKCIGNLVSKKHIITVAHCLIEDEVKAPSKTVSVRLGKYILEISNEPGSLNRDVSEIKFHPDYQRIYPLNADSDLAILVLKDPVEYTLTIQPICLWQETIELDKIVGKSGIVVSWGKYGKNYVGELRMTSAKIVSQEECLRSDPGFRIITSNRTFCAGNRNGQGPCEGDSGSGLFMFDPDTGRYHLRGIVSISLYDIETKTCNLQQYIVYVDLAKYRNWIERQISNDLDYD